MPRYAYFPVYTTYPFFTRYTNAPSPNQHGCTDTINTTLPVANSQLREGQSLSGTPTLGAPFSLLKPLSPADYPDSQESLYILSPHHLLVQPRYLCLPLGTWPCIFLLNMCCNHSPHPSPSL